MEGREPEVLQVGAMAGRLVCGDLQGISFLLRDNDGTAVSRTAHMVFFARWEFRSF